MKTRLIPSGEVERLLTMKDCIPAMRRALQDLSAGDAVMLQRLMLPQAEGNLFSLMPGASGKAGFCGAKVVVFPGPKAAREGTSQGIIPLFDPATGGLRAILDAGPITALRTAAASAVATDLLALPDAGVLALLGAGRIGRLHLEAMAAVRPIHTVKVWNRTPERAQALCREAETVFGLQAVLCARPQEAVEGAQIICTVTSAREPFVRGEWVAPGAHLNAVGMGQELFPDLLPRCRIFADQTQAVLRDSKNLQAAFAAGLPQGAVLGELGQLLLGQLAGRQDAQQITLFESVGLPLEDLYAAALVLEKAQREGAGAEFSF